MSHQVIRTTSQVTGQNRICSCAVKRNTGFNTIPRAVAWDRTVVATRHQAINIFAGIGVTILGQILEQLRFENPRSRPRAT